MVSTDPFEIFHLVSSVLPLLSQSGFTDMVNFSAHNYYVPPPCDVFLIDVGIYLLGFRLVQAPIVFTIRT